jgi:hypothetical protein
VLLLLLGQLPDPLPDQDTVFQYSQQVNARVLLLLLLLPDKTAALSMQLASQLSCCCCCQSARCLTRCLTRTAIFECT